MRVISFAQGSMEVDYTLKIRFIYIRIK